MSAERELVVDAGGTLVLVVAYEDERLVWMLAEIIDDLLHKLAVGVVKTVKGLVEDEQFGVLDESAGQEHQALLAARHV